jgi:ribosomal protein S27E
VAARQACYGAGTVTTRTEVRVGRTEPLRCPGCGKMLAEPLGTWRQLTSVVVVPAERQYGTAGFVVSPAGRTRWYRKPSRATRLT